MKKLLPVLLIAITIASQAQTVYVPSGTSGIGSSTNGNVGIGTNAPEAKLEVNGDISLPSYSGNKSIYTWSAGDPNWRIGMSQTPGFMTSMTTNHVQYLTYGSASTQGFAVGVNGGQSSLEVRGSDHAAFFRGNVGIGTTALLNGLNVYSFNNFSGGSIRFSHSGANDAVLSLGYNSVTGRDALKLSYFQHNSTSGQTDLMTLDTNGNVGIGTSSPDTRFHLYEPSTNAIGKIETPVGAAAMIYKTGNEEWQVGNQAYGTTGFNFATGTSVKMSIKSSGAVGIGTTSPGSLLDVNGSGHFTTTLDVGGNAATHGDLEIGRGDGQDTKLRFHNYNAGWYSMGLDMSDGKFKINGGGNLGDATHFAMDWNGNVGIGNTNPDAKLTVSGQVHAQEVKVTVNAPGPDYVFENDYKLTSLEEIKNYIDQNKHLPEVPSAKEMEKNGVQLGEMNMLLLKKIEELTLHMIEMKDRNTTLEQENKSILQRLATLEEKTKK